MCDVRIECENCCGDGWVACLDRVYPDEPHMADVGHETCYECSGTGYVYKDE